jgi:hypothetical protein
MIHLWLVCTATRIVATVSASSWVSPPNIRMAYSLFPIQPLVEYNAKCGYHDTLGGYLLFKKVCFSKPFQLHFFTWSFIVWKTCLNYEYKWNTAQLMLNHNQSTNIIWNIDIWHVISSKFKLESQRNNESKFRTGLPGALGHSGHYPDFQVANVTTFRVCIVDCQYLENRSISSTISLFC